MKINKLTLIGTIIGIVIVLVFGSFYREYELKKAKIKYLESLPPITGVSLSSWDPDTFDNYYSYGENTTYWP